MNSLGFRSSQGVELQPTLRFTNKQKNTPRTSRRVLKDSHITGRAVNLADTARGSLREAAKRREGSELHAGGVSEPERDRAAARRCRRSD